MYQLPLEHSPNSIHNPLINSLPDRVVIPSLEERLLKAGIDIESLEECRQLLDSMPLHCLTNNKRIQSINDNRMAARLKRKEQEEFNTKHLLTGFILGLPSWELMEKDNIPHGATALFWTLPRYQKKTLIVAWLLLATNKNIFTRTNLFNFLSIQSNNKEKIIYKKALEELIRLNYIEAVKDVRRIEKLTGLIKRSGKLGQPVVYYLLTRQGAQLLKPYLLEILKQAQERTGLLLDNELISKLELFSNDFIYSQNL